MARMRFIAETDDSGRVVWVWSVGPGDRVARPVGTASLHLSSLGQAEFFGAPEASVKHWLERHASGMQGGTARMS